VPDLTWQGVAVITAGYGLPVYAIVNSRPLSHLPAGTARTSTAMPPT